MNVDHIVYGVRDLTAGVDAIESLLGVRPAAGGRHAGRGTHNALLSLGGGAYLEIIAPDPEQPAPQQPRAFGLDTLREPHLITWATKSTDIVQQAERARAAGVDPGQVLQMSRERPDGLTLHWALTYTPQPLGDGVVPFLISWALGPHPSETSPGGCHLVSLTGEHPEPGRIAAMLEAIGVDLPVERAERPALIVAVQSPNGTVVLR